MTSRWPGGDPRDLARTIAAEPRFHGTTAPVAPGPTLLERALNWVFERIGDLFRGVAHALGVSNAWTGIVSVALALAIVVGVIALGLRIARRRGRERHAPAVPASAALVPALTSAQLLAQARAFARDECWHEAASALVRAALLALDERGRLRFDPARTAGEARRLLYDPQFDAFEREATTALFAAGEATPERIACLREAYALTFGEPA